MKRMLQISLFAVVLMTAFAAQAADRKADLQKKIATLKRHRAEQVELMHKANLIDPSLGESYKGVIAADDRKISEYERHLAAE